jgi:eukaryotic-like serine/threonine-protein kinase
MTDDDVTRTEDEGATLDLPEGLRGFAPGQVLGERYRVLELLGRGGMGEVWHAFDLKLRVEVALKALREDLFKSERRLEMLRDEVRAAREVVSPNVCRIFDLIEIEGRELVSMEYVDGATLLGVLLERGPLELKEAQDIASQFLAGLEAIHKAGLIHRDIKPENIMLTRAGRVVVMDFGLARQETEGGGTVSGTPAYMAPEQAAGQTLDARADVYAAGVVLAEMVCPDGIKSIQSRQSVWEGVRSEPAKVPDTPWAAVIRKAVAKDREGRYNSAHTLTRALEDVTLRVEGAEDLHPYPGLASFTENDAEYFFGREAEVEQMWRKFEGPARMLAIAGPSGAGKTSFVRAGLTPHAQIGWAIFRCTPGDAPFSALAGALASETTADPDLVKLLLRFHEPDVAVDLLGRWRRRHDHALLVVDQFEELFTLNPVEIQGRFSDLLSRLVLEADIVVLLSLRDDYLFRCHQYEPLRPALSDLTMLGPPEGAALRRALTQPALQCGYRFEDDEMVEEMLAEVEGERGALPLLAFAAARLWEKRDRNTGLLTRTAFHDIGGVGGALARHAEATVDRIGHEHLPIVRELFRNLVTAEGTRAVREWDELLSVFCDSSNESQAAVLRSLIDARLLTSYEVREEDRKPARRVEIIHESLLANWPASCAGRPRMQTPRSSATSSARRRRPGMNTAAPTTCCGPARPTLSSPSGASATPADSPSSRRPLPRP